MCGIAGIVRTAPLEEPQHRALDAMSEALAHRGPDDAGDFRCDGVGLAMRRLAIIDLDGGRQPFRSSDGQLAVVANGEIYDFVERRAELESKGHRFRTGSDCETILHLYEEHGLDFVHSLRGMFALAIWDGRARRLVLARDRMGEKPLYVAEREGALYFASELRALLASRALPSKLDPEAVDLYFHYGYVPEPQTVLQGVRKLPAAHLLVVDADRFAVEERRYWRMTDASPRDEEPTEALAEAFDAVGRIVLRSDVPVGVALSGGVDSSAVAALAARHARGPVHALSIGYQGRPASDERAAACALARHLEMPFHEIEVGDEEVAEHFPQLVAERDDPIADPAGHGYWAVMRAARDRSIPVMLMGQGGDELFWGYEWVRMAARWAETPPRRNPLPWLETAHALAPPRGLRPWLGALRRARSLERRHAGARDGRLIFYELEAGFEQAQRRTGAFYPARLQRALAGHDPGTTVSKIATGGGPSEQLMELICGVYLAENGIAQADRLGMASSVELRLPLLDHRLVETVVGLAKARPNHREPPKRRLHGALRSLLPDWVFDRPKRGFQPPVGRWSQATFAAHGALLEDGELVARGVATGKAARNVARLGSRRPTDWFCYKALVLEAWCRAVLS